MKTTVVVVDKKGFAEHYDVECQILVPDILRAFREHYTNDTELMGMVCHNSGWYGFECRQLMNGFWELTVSTRYNCHDTHVCNFKM